MSYFLIPNRPPKNNKSIDEVIAGLKKTETIIPEVPPAPGEKPNTGDLPPTTDFCIEEIAEGYRVTGINYRSKIVAYDFATKTLPSKTQEQHAEHALKAKQDEFIASNAPLVYALCKTLCQNKDGKQKDLVEKARKTLEGILGPGKPWINTLSRAVYYETGQGEIIYDYKQTTQYPSKPAKLVGPDGYITNTATQAEDYTHALFDTNDSMQEINEVFKWITGKETYAYRLNSNPAKKQEWVVALGVGNYDVDIFIINSDGGIYDVRPALGVRRAKIFAGNEG